MLPLAAVADFLRIDHRPDRRVLAACFVDVVPCAERPDGRATDSTLD